MEFVEVNLDIYTPRGKTWLAQITDIGGRYGLVREFVSGSSSDTSRSGKTGTRTYYVGPGAYEANEPRMCPERTFFVIYADGTRVDHASALDAFNAFNS